MMGESTNTKQTEKTARISTISVKNYGGNLTDRSNNAGGSNTSRSNRPGRYGY